MEIYKVISDYPNYEVSNLGNVRNIKTGYLLRLDMSKRGYFVIGLYKDSKQKKFSVHRLVANAFLPNPENKRTVNHIDGDKTNNCVSNLEWATDSENNLHAIRTGLRTKNGRPKQPVRCVETGQEFESITETSLFFSCVPNSIRQSIYKGCRCKGFHFELI